MSAAPARMRLAAAATALPGPPVGNAELGARLGLAPDWIDLFIGTRTRHFAVDLADGTVRYGLADLAQEAGRTALARAGLGPGGVDFLVLATATPDARLAATAAVVAA
ncbi:3-oxoacyl-ACP synthase, partial [Kitasatospora sp. NPDC059571]